MHVFAMLQATLPMQKTIKIELNWKNVEYKKGEKVNECVC